MKYIYAPCLQGPLLNNATLAVPSLDKFPPTEAGKIPGELIFRDGYITLNSGRTAVVLNVTNTGDRPIQVCVLLDNFLSILRAQDFQFLPKYFFALHLMEIDELLPQPP